MLNIGKLGPQSAEYYLEHVAQGAEDYYLHAGEAPGRWLGVSAGSIGLRGEVGAEQLTALLDGVDPVSGSVLAAARPGHERLPGYDLTFRAPKSVSLLFALGEGEVSREVKVAHEESVVAAVEYLERETAFSRRRLDGHIVPVRGEGFVAAAFQHRTSRAGDPLLHHHVLVANVVRSADGRWGALDGRLLYRHAKTAGYLYQAELRAQLARRLGVEWTPTRRGTAEIKGIPHDVLAAFSRRRGQIVARMAERGESSARAAQAATLDTRRSKDYSVSPEGLLPEWRSRAQALGLGRRELAEAVHPEWRGPHALTRLEVVDAVAALVAPTGLTAQASSFDRRDVVRALCDQLGEGAGASAIERIADAFLHRHEVVPLGPEGGAASVPMPGAGEGPAAPSTPDERRFTTRDLLAVERAVVEGCLQRNTRARTVMADAGRRGVSNELNPVWAPGTAPVEPRHVDAAMRRRPSLSEEQAAMVRRLTMGGDAVVVVSGPAGTGKTYGLDACREVWQRSGYAVVGCALSAQAARQLQAGAGISSTTIDRLLLDLVNHRDEVLPRMHSVLVVDEAGMVGTRLLDRLLAKAQRADAKVVLVGDERQLPEIDAGGAFRGLRERLGAVELTANRRQTEEWERQALGLLRDGRTDEAMAAYCEHGRVVVGPSADAIRARIVVDWWAAEQDGGTGSGVMVAQRRADVAELNERARAVRVAAGEVSGPELELPSGTFGVGDRIVTTRNARDLGVVNGTRATVTDVDQAGRSLTIERDQGDGGPGGTVTLPRDYLDAGHVRHAYAITGHKAQGMTAQSAFVLGDETIYREWGYVALSRGRVENRLYVVAPDPDLPDDPGHGRRWVMPDGTVLREVSRALDHSRAQRLALDQVVAEAGGASSERPQLERAARQLDDGELRAAAACADAALRTPRPELSEPWRGDETLRALHDKVDRLEASRTRALETADGSRQRLDATGGPVGRHLHSRERFTWTRDCNDATHRVASIDHELVPLRARVTRVDADAARVHAWERMRADAAQWRGVLEDEAERRVDRRVAAAAAAPVVTGHGAAPRRMSERGGWRQELREDEQRDLWRGVVSSDPVGRSSGGVPVVDAGIGDEDRDRGVDVGAALADLDAAEAQAEARRPRHGASAWHVAHDDPYELDVHRDVAHDSLHHRMHGASISM